LLAAFTLPTIALIALSPPAHWRNLILSLFVASTGLLLASFQLSVGRLFHDAAPWNEIRAVLAFLGLICMASGLALLAAAQTAGTDRGVLYVAQVILAAGVLVPIAMNIWLWAAARSGTPPAVSLPDSVVRALESDTAIGKVRLAGSRASGGALPLSDWDFRIETDTFAQVMEHLPALVKPLHPVVAQWDRLSSTWCYMLILAGPVKVDLIFSQPHAALPAWRVTAGTMNGIDDHFWDWILWLSAKRAAGEFGLLAAELGKLHEHLLGPLGVAAAPATLDQAICDYRQARSEWERVLDLQVPRAAEQAVLQGIYS
jgi:hypothetical protein